MRELTLASFAAASDTHLVGEPRSARFAAFKAAFDARAELERLHALGFRFLGRSDPAFPPLLRAIHDPPPGLFLRGNAEASLLALPAVAIVGARACSAYGRQIARSVARELASAGLVVVSGLARGVDAEAHRGALEAGGITVAVLGCGIDRDYPAANRELARQMAASGLIVSEYAPGVEPAPWRFPARNRIVAGSLFSLRGRRGPRAQRCLDHGRFRARGGERSLRGSGRDHECALRRLERAAQARRDAAHLRPGRARELRARRGGPRRSRRSALQRPRACEVREAAAGADELARATGLAAEELAVALTELELAGAVTEEGGVYRAG